MARIAALFYYSSPERPGRAIRWAEMGLFVEADFDVPPEVQERAAAGDDDALREAIRLARRAVWPKARAEADRIVEALREGEG